MKKIQIGLFTMVLLFGLAVCSSAASITASVHTNSTITIDDKVTMSLTANGDSVKIDSMSVTIYDDATGTKLSEYSEEYYTLSDTTLKVYPLSYDGLQLKNSVVVYESLEKYTSGTKPEGSTQGFKTASVETGLHSKIVELIQAGKLSLSKVRVVVTCTLSNTNTTSATFYYNLTTTTAIITITSNPENNESVTVGQAIRITAISNNSLIGLTAVSYNLYNDAASTLLSSKSYSYSSSGVSPASYDVAVPSTTASKLRLEVTYTDKSGAKTNKTFYYYLPTNIATITISADPGNNSTLEIGDSIRMTATSDNSSVGLTAVSYDLYNDINGSRITTNSYNYNAAGITPAVYDIKIPSTTAQKVKLEVTFTDKTGQKTTKTTYYNITGNVTNVSVTSSPANNATVTIDQTITLVATSENSSVGLTTMSYAFYNDKTGAKITEGSYNFKSGGITPASYDLKIPASYVEKLRLELVYTDKNGQLTNKTFYYNMTGNLATITVAADPVTNAAVAIGSIVRMTATSNNSLIGLTNISYTIYNNSTSEKIDTKSYSFNNVSPASYDIKIPSTSIKNIRIEVEYTDRSTQKTQKTFYYQISGNAEVTVTSSPKTNSQVLVGQSVTITATSDTSSVGLVSVYYTLYNETTGAKIASNSSSYSSSGVTPAAYTIKIPSTTAKKLMLEITFTDKNSVKTTKTFYYTLSTDAIYDLDVSNYLSGLTIDSRLEQENNFYKFDEYIPFRIDYYNAYNKSRTNVKIQVDIPDGFYVQNEGGGSLSKKVLTFNLGTLAQKATGMVYFTLVAEDDSNKEKAYDITSRITYEGDIEDTSISRIFIYYKGSIKKHTAYITGYEDGTFKPDNYITREEVATMFARALELTTTKTKSSFSDLKTDRWSFGSVMSCADASIINGYPDGTFVPTGNITRAELYAMAYKAVDKDLSKSLYVPYSYNKDSAWERDYIAGLSRMNMLSGMPDTTSSKKATRAEVVYVINRILLRYADTTSSSKFSDIKNHWAIADIIESSETHNYERSGSGYELPY